jgi:hypothetical protein
VLVIGRLHRGWSPSSASPSASRQQVYFGSKHDCCQWRLSLAFAHDRQIYALHLPQTALPNEMGSQSCRVRGAGSRSSRRQSGPSFSVDRRYGESGAGDSETIVKGEKRQSGDPEACSGG